MDVGGNLLLITVSMYSETETSPSLAERSAHFQHHSVRAVIGWTIHSQGRSSPTTRPGWCWIWLVFDISYSDIYQDPTPWGALSGSPTAGSVGSFIGHPEGRRVLVYIYIPCESKTITRMVFRGPERELPLLQPVKI